MKNYTTLIVVASIFVNQLFSQEPLGEISYDTLINGNILVTIPQEAGTVYELLFTPEEFLPPIDMFDNQSNFDFSSYYQDDLISNIFTPDSIGGCIPIDFCYNPYMEKLYYYGGRNIVIIDAVTREKLKEITVSEVADVIYTVSYNALLPYLKERGYRNILYNSAQNKVYCATLGGELVIIDCYTDQIINTIASEEIQNVFSTSIAFDFNKENILWFVNEQYHVFMSHLFKIDCNDDIITGKRHFNHTGIYDVIPSNNDSILLLSTFNNANHRIHALQSSDLATITQFGESNTGKLFINEGLLYADLLNANTLLVYNLNKYNYVGNISISYDKILQGFVNRRYDLMYFSARNSSGGTGIIIIDCRTFQEIAVHLGNFTFSLYYDNLNGLVYFGGRDYIKAFNANSNHQQIIYQSSNNKNVPTRILAGPDQSIITSNQISGTTSFFNSELNLLEEVQIGANFVFGCYNPINDKIYYIHSFTENVNSYLAIFDAVTLETITEIPLGGYLNHIVYNPHNNKVYVSSEDKRRVFVIDGDTDQLLQNETILLPQNRVPMKLYISSTNNIYISVIGGRIYIYDGDNHNLLNEINTTAYTISFGENTQSNIVYAGQVASNPAIITAINDLTYQKISDINISSPAYYMCYNSMDNILYVSSMHANRVYEIKGTNIVKEFNLNMPTHLAYNHHDNKVYVHSLANVLTVIKGSNIIKTVAIPHGSIHYSGINNQLYCFSLGLIDPNQIIVLDATLDEVTRVIPMKQGQKTSWSFMDVHNTLVLAEDNNRLFVGNFAFSNMSVVQCLIDTLQLQKGWTWLSFPRLERYGNNTVHPGPVLERTGCFPLGWELYSINKNIRYDLVQQQWIGNLTGIKSTEGYKLYGEVPAAECMYLVLHGARLHHDTTITLMPAVENWIGYFITYPQRPWDVFPDDLYNNRLTEIKAQHWTMVKIPDQWYGSGKWIAAGNVRPIKYGDMVSVRINGTTPVTFTWNYSGKHEVSEGRPDTKYYEFDEQADYLPVFIETEPDSDIQEIAILADNEVRGAVVRLPGDTLVQINAYIMDLPPGTPLEFETWSGTKSQRTGRGAYSVLNQQTRRYEPRTLYSGENKSFQFVSLKPKAETEVLPPITELACSPNPFSDKTVFSFTLGEEANLQLVIYDLLGKVVAIPASGTFAPGSYSIAWNGEGLHGRQSGNGVYIYRLTNSSGQEFSGKVVLIE